MPLVVGIDEAGYGPLLGPLVVAATLWRVEPSRRDADFWECLGGAITRSAGRGEGRLPVGDSKQLFERKQGLASLERTVLAFAAALGLRHGTLGGLLEALSPVSGFLAGTRPWYRDLNVPLPRDAVRSVCVGASERLKRTMASAGVSCCGLAALVITEDAFNERLRQTRNKAAVLTEAVLRLLSWAADRSGTQQLCARVDRLGGRHDYRRLLMQAFPERHLHELERSPVCSRYRLSGNDSDWLVEFAVEGECRHLPIALASMLAKYVRELLMERFNAYWRTLRPDLRPTAGYYQDAQRFLSEIRPLLARGDVHVADFVRAR